jgi:iron uptake system component EfeO
VADPLAPSRDVPHHVRQGRQRRDHLTHERAPGEIVSGTWSRAGAAAILAGLIALTVAGCGGGSSSKTSSGGNGKTVAVSLTDKGCDPSEASVPAGPVTFNVRNAGTAKVTEFELKNRDGIIIGERENVVEGLDGSFTLTVDPGEYEMACPNGDGHATGKLTVTGKATGAHATASAAVLKQATTGYHAYIVAQSAKLLAATTSFVAALGRGDLAAARTQFGPARSYYERIEPVAESFGNLDPEIDARVNDVPNVSSWTGFHRIEQILWVGKTTTGTGPYATKLLADVTTLDTKVQTLTFQPAQLANGAVELLNEVAGSKITGEEDRYSHTDLSDFSANVEGAQKAYELLRPALLERRDGALVKTLNARFAEVFTGLAPYRRDTPLGFALYGELTSSDRKTLAQAIDALAEPLSTVASKVLA